MPREFCQADNCDGEIEFSGNDDGDIGVCLICGKKYELRVEYEVVPLEA